MNNHYDVIVIGAGPAGLMAACRAAERGRKTLLLEKNRRAGLKILLSGGNRCNLTHATDARGIAAAFGSQGNFLRSALAALGPDAVVDLFATEGVPTHVEPDTGKIFPQSNRATDVLAALLARLARTACTLTLAEPVQDLKRQGDRFVVITGQTPVGQVANLPETEQVSNLPYEADAVVLTTGGLSYPASGSTGDGWRWAAALGHTIVPPRPALVPVATHAPWILALQGITLPDIVVRVVEKSGGLSQFSPQGRAATADENGTVPLRPAHPPRVLDERRGALLFAHFGVTGPAVLDVSRAVSGHPQPASLALRCDLLPDVKIAQLETRVQQACAAAGKRLAAGLLTAWLPQRVAETIAAQAGIDAARRVAELTRQERQSLARGAKEFDIPVAGTMGFRKAEVTAGGVSLAEVDSRTMQSKLAPGLYLAGEVLDLDGRIGGYNFQAAFSTGWLAGENA
jgi:predicted flavoprotein YhiN